MGLSLDDFLGHSQSSEGGGKGAKNLTGWRKRTPPIVDVALHTDAEIHPLWKHGIPKFVTTKDKETGVETVHVWGGDHVCHEHEDILRKQYHRDRDTGEREAPPRICPLCILNEKLRQMVADGEIGFADPVFKFEGDVPKETVVLHAGGMYGGFNSKNITPEEKKAMSKAGLKQSEAWKENNNAKCNYLFVVVDVNDPEAGIQIAVEGTALGDKVKEVIGDTMTQLGRDDGNPMLNPYAIRWQHVPKAKNFGDRYKALRMPKLELSDEVLDLIQNQPAPDVTNRTTPFDIAKMRTMLEEALVDGVDLDFDEIFGPAEKFYGDKSALDGPDPSGARSAVEEPEDDEEESEDDEEESEDEETTDEELVECNACGSMISPTLDECDVCGFDIAGARAKVAKKKVAKKKVAKKKVAKKKVAKKKATRRKKPEPEEESDGEEPEDDFPY